MTPRRIISNDSKNEIIIMPPEDGDLHFLNQVINNASEDCSIRFVDGIYQINETIILPKSIRLVGGGIGKTVLHGNNIPLLLSATGIGKNALEGITFRNDTGGEPATTVRISAKSLHIKSCSFSGGVSGEGGFGMGLDVGGETKAVIEDCHFEDNQECGLRLADKSTGTVKDCSATDNDAGLAVEGDANVVLTRNELFENHVGLGYNEGATGRIEKNSIRDNRGGIVARGRSTPLIIKNIIIRAKAAIMLGEECNVFIEENIITENETGILMRHSSKARIEKNEIYGNATGVRINEEATAIIENNKIYQNTGDALEDNSENESTVGENEIYDNGESIEDDRNDSKGFSIGDLIAKMLGSENLSNNPNVAFIPISDEMLRSGKTDSEKSESKGDKSESDLNDDTEDKDSDEEDVER
jgi:parallel beta-helix repeat protein